jgi:hypothetical protein
MRLLSFLLLAAIHGYRYVLSPLWPGVCRFEPSCSAYALTAVRRFGALRGSWMGGTGLDPVPQVAAEKRIGTGHRR